MEKKNAENACTQEKQIQFPEELHCIKSIAFKGIKYINTAFTGSADYLKISKAP